MGIGSLGFLKLLMLQWNSRPWFLTSVRSKSKVTQNILRLQEWHQNTRNGKSLFTRRLIHYNTFTLGKNPKTCSERQHLASVRFMNVLFKTTTCPRWPRKVVLYRFDCNSIEKICKFIKVRIKNNLKKYIEY